MAKTKMTTREVNNLTYREGVGYDLYLGSTRLGQCRYLVKSVGEVDETAHLKVQSLEGGTLCTVKPLTELGHLFCELHNIT